MKLCLAHLRCFLRYGQAERTRWTNMPRHLWQKRLCRVAQTSRATTVGYGRRSPDNAYLNQGLTVRAERVLERLCAVATGAKEGPVQLDVQGRSLGNAEARAKQSARQTSKVRLQRAHASGPRRSSPRSRGARSHLARLLRKECVVGSCAWVFAQSFAESSWYRWLEPALSEIRGLETCQNERFRGLRCGAPCMPRSRRPARSPHSRSCPLPQKSPDASGAENPSSSLTLYEGKIVERDEVPTRLDDWHDLFNALAFISVSRAKWELHGASTCA